jgi:hypothetical protein
MWALQLFEMARTALQVGFLQAHCKCFFLVIFGFGQKAHTARLET